MDNAKTLKFFLVLDVRGITGHNLMYERIKSVFIVPLQNATSANTFYIYADK